MDSTEDSPRPGSRTEKMKMGVDSLAHASKSATGENIGPERLTGVGNEDAPDANTVELEPELRGKPEKGTRLDSDT